MKKKSVKGMTLVEILIALFVFSVISLILVDVGKSVNSMVKNSNHVNKKTSIESPLVENGYSALKVNFTEGKAADGVTRDRRKDVELVTVDNSQLEPVQGNLKVSMEYNHKVIALTGKSFTVAKRAAGNATATTGSDLQYIYVSKALTSGSNKWVDVAPADGSSGGSSGSGSNGNGEVKPAAGQ